MPKVGEKHFSYSKKGKKAAKQYARKTGKKVKYGGGGKVSGKKAKYSGGGKVKKTSGRKR
jgi:hypothetical protein